MSKSMKQFLSVLGIVLMSYLILYLLSFVIAPVSYTKIYTDDDGLTIADTVYKKEIYHKDGKEEGRVKFGVEKPYRAGTYLKLRTVGGLVVSDKPIDKKKVPQKVIDSTDEVEREWYQDE